MDHPASSPDHPLGWDAPEAAARMRERATAFLSALRPEQHADATAPFDVADHREWTYLPGPRPGLSLADMTGEQRDLAMALLDAGVSARGGKDTRGIMTLDGILRELEKEAGDPGFIRRHPHFYWFRVLGDPAGSAPWAWRVNGHHLAVHLTIVGDAVAGTPQFFGANPAVVPHGPHAGLQTLPVEEHLARDLLGSLDEGQRQVAITSAVAPDDILTRRDPVANPGVIPAGLPYARMGTAQQSVLTDLIRHYVERVHPDLARASWASIVDAGLERVQFTWAGTDRRGEGHYYAVTGPTFLLEYDNTQSNANHVHTVWRELRHDWGQDVLAAHYAAHRSGNGHVH